MDGYLKIRNLRVQCTVGILEHERHQLQELLVDLTCQADLSECVQSDSIEDAIDYRQLAQVLQDVAKAEHFNLVETYANEALQVLFAQFPLDWCKIRVKKKALALADYIAVELEQEA
ncbi:MAG: Dihydroneopterin aldolase [Chlamydiales bacterium]|nr:Dihydroneopterin aldolase [Chlamydiales bacterium]MCH9635189.1 Dihydroneopterin aldolase [Chlamydiales bacterium]MCH9704269.1 dihydroneopterin aldolase [Chlamydiota bacterium]